MSFKLHGLFEVYRFSHCFCSDITCICSTGALINSQRSAVQVIQLTQEMLQLLEGGEGVVSILQQLQKSGFFS